MDSSEASSTPAVAVHPAVVPLSFLLGTWRGEGEGGFPTIKSFKYGEELHFFHPGNKPVIAYSQKTWKLNSGEPMHAESGYWRPKPDGTLEVIIAQSTGLAEVQKGTYDGEEKVVKLQSELVANASKVSHRGCGQAVPKTQTIIGETHLVHAKHCSGTGKATPLLSLQLYFGPSPLAQEKISLLLEVSWFARHPHRCLTTHHRHPMWAHDTMLREANVPLETPLVATSEINFGNFPVRTH